MTQFIALPDVGTVEKIRLLVYMSAQGDKVAHVPLSALMRTAMVREEEIESEAGFRHYADGTLVQWGQGSGLDPLIYFPRAFSHHCWHISLTNGQAVADRVIIRSAVNRTLSSFVAQGRFVDFSGASGSADTDFDWMAFGR